MIRYALPLAVAVILFASLFAFALKYHWITQEIDTGPVVPGSMTIILSQDGSSFHMTYSAVGGGLVYATNASGHWVKASLTSDPVSRTSIFIDSKKAIHISAIKTASGEVVSITNAKGSWNTTVVDTGANPLASCPIAVDTLGLGHMTYQKGAALMYAEGRAGNWSTDPVQPVTKLVPKGSSNSTTIQSGLLVEDKGTPHIVYDINSVLVGYVHEVNSMWNNTILHNGISAEEATIEFDHDGKIHMCYFGNGITGDSKAQFGLMHAVNEGRNNTLLSQAVRLFDASVANGSKLFVGLDYDKRIHAVYDRGQGIEYVTGSWNGTYHSPEISKDVTKAGLPVVVDWSGRMYFVLDGQGTKLVTNNLTVWDQMGLNREFSIVAGVGVAIALAFVAFNYLMDRRPRTA